MVIGAAGHQAETETKANTMTTLPERSRSLQNFSSLPCFNVRWGRQKQLRCVKDSASSDHDLPTSSSSSPNRRHDFLKRKSPDDIGIEAMREKLMLEIRTEVHQMKATILSESRRNDDVAPRPWNLRSRRALCKEPAANDKNNNDRNNKAGDRRPSFSPARHVDFKSSAEIGGDGGGCGPRAKFSASLSKQEIEEDFLSILGNRPARRPKKRSRYVQRQIDALCPGYWLSEITADMYKVNENPEASKK